ncbi:hypothetical protein [Xylanibacter ruminicola]|uniref:Uncharacterized protein n=1 Tax=Xylanibacter ruminicola TaxID=839 RepID=A0A1M6ZCN4_XYLRU|nr:hypothetical protein [Xylanibacter ruminicola]SHL28105.1 hypothetical protein SAMN05216463_1502 [Xylanibacter ruminicola]
MKRLVSILLLVFAVTIGFAQSSTPDYIQKAKVGLTQYYPQFKDYFEPIFGKIMGLKDSSRNLINSKIHDNLDTFSDEISSEKERNTVVLLVLERFVGKDQFQKSAVFGATDEDIRIAVANEIVYDVELTIKKEIRGNEKRIAKLKEMISLVNNSTKSRETTEEIAIKIEEFFDLYEVNDIKNVSGLQNIIKQYINFNKQINRRPSPTGQKFIDEYNRITKSK